MGAVGKLTLGKTVRRTIMMKAMLNLALVAALATVVFAREIGNINHHRERRAVPALLAYKAGGSGASPLPPHVDPNIGQSTAQLNSMATGASMSGPLAVLGILNILASGVMAMNYFQSVNGFQRRANYANAGPYLQKRSTQTFDLESVASFIKAISESKKRLA